jgi:release factor glutamine methyltransferase
VSSVAEVLRVGVRRLREAGIPEPARDARVLMAAALRVGNGQLTLFEPEPAFPEVAARFEASISARVAHRPVSQILGQRRFRGLVLDVTRDVLDPRPETELLVDFALSKPSAGRILDLGTGSGALLLTLLSEWQDATGVGIDASAAALEVARRNAARLRVTDRADFRLGNWCEGLAEAFDLVVCNPPYIASGEIEDLDPSVRDWEPRMALTAGPTGLESYAWIATRLRRVLRGGGRALFEIGSGQGETVPALMRHAGFRLIRLHRDLGEKARCVEISL